MNLIVFYGGPLGPHSNLHSTKALFLFLKIIIFRKKVIFILANHRFQQKLLLSLSSNLIFNHKCQFHLQQTSFLTQNAILNFEHCNIQSKMQFSFWENFYFGQILFSNYKAICKFAQHKFCFALTLVFSFQQIGVFIPAKQNFHPSKTQFSDCRRQYPKTVGQATCRLDTFTLLLKSIFSRS